MGYKASNNADTTLSESITPTSTTISVATGHGDDFPTLGASDWTLITITDKNGAREIIKIIARTGDTMTVGTTPGGEADVGGRAQEGTTALSITYTDDHSVRCCPTAGLIEAMADYSDQGDLTATPAEIEAVCKGNTATAAELSELHESGVVKADLEKLHDITLSASQINALASFEALKNDFEALRTCFSGSSAPGNPVAGMWWYDTTANILKLRNEANNAWLNVYNFANGYAIGCSNTVLAGTGIAVSGSLRTGNVTVSATTIPYTAGERLLLQADGGAISNYTTYTTVETIQLDRPGTLRISFKLTATATGSSSGPATCTARGCIYRDRGGAVTAVGTARSVSVTSTDGTQTTSQTYSQDISGWQAGDKVLLRGYCTKSLSGVGTYGSGSISDIRLLTGNAYGLTVVE
jgi:hypothetical protein